METVVLFNQGKEARRRGEPREAPVSVMYPVVSRYQPFRREEAFLDSHQQKAWLRGYDGARW